MKGKLFGIGVGPGDPDLLTLKAIRAIQSCDVIAIPNSGAGDRTAFSHCRILSKWKRDTRMSFCNGEGYGKAA